MGNCWGIRRGAPPSILHPTPSTSLRAGIPTSAPGGRLGGAWGPHHSEPRAVTVPRSHRLASDPLAHLPDSAAATNSLNPRSRRWGQHGKGRALAAEPATRSGEAGFQGSRGPEAARSSTGQSRRKLSPLLARLRPPYSRRRIRDGTERRRGQAAQRASSLRAGPGPAPLPAQTLRAAADPGAFGAARAQTAPPGVQAVAFLDLEWAANRELEDHEGSGRPCPSSL